MGKIVQWITPPLPGTRVMVDPTTQSTSYFKGYGVLDKMGVITDVDGLFNDDGWLLRDRSDWTINVLFENGKTIDVMLYDLIPISGSFVELEIYRMKNGRTYQTLTQEDMIEEAILMDKLGFEVTNLTKEYRINELEQLIKKYDMISQEDFDAKQVERINMRYMGIIDELAVTKSKEPTPFNVEEKKSPKARPVRVRPVEPRQVSDITDLF